MYFAVLFEFTPYIFDMNSFGNGVQQPAPLGNVQQLHIPIDLLMKIPTYRKFTK